MARHDARSATLCKPIPKRDLPFHHQPLVGRAVGDNGNNLRRGSLSAQQSHLDSPAGLPQRIGREGRSRPTNGGRGLLISPQRPSVSTATGDLSTRIGLVEDEEKRSKPKQA